MIRNDAPKHSKFPKGGEEVGKAGNFGYPMKIQDIVVDTPPSSYNTGDRSGARNIVDDIADIEMTNNNENSPDVPDEVLVE